MSDVNGGKLDNTMLDGIITSCRNGERAVCEKACPLGVPVKDILKKCAKGNLQGAVKSFRKAVIMPRIIAAVCDGRCTSHCTAAGGQIHMNDLERALCRLIPDIEYRKYYVMPKKKHVLVVGGGLTGFTCAVRLSGRGYDVTLAEKDNKLCGRLRQMGLMPEEALDKEIDAIVSSGSFLKTETGMRVDTLEDIDFDGCFIAVGSNGEALAATAGGRGVLVMDHTWDEDDLLSSAGAGIEASYVLEKYLKVGVMDRITEPQTPSETRVPDEEICTTGAVVSEAGRCLQCDCTYCIDTCDLMEFYKRDPRQIAIDMGTLLNNTSVTHRVGVRMAASCSQCGACGPVCPESIDMKQAFVKCKTFLVETEGVSPVFTEFWLDDMAFSDSDEASFLIPEQGKCRYLFFPGCQLGASDPQYVIRSFDMLREKYESTGIYQGCCGMPGVWACREDLVKESVGRIRDLWEQTGCPVMILACPSCARMLAGYLPEIQTAFIWDLLAAEDIGEGTEIGVFDPCASADVPEEQHAIRRLAAQCGFAVKELPLSDKVRCCGTGGLIRVANPELYDRIVRKNIDQSSLPFLTYCINCRDVFASYGKDTLHILDVLVMKDLRRCSRKPPSISQKKENRRMLKQTMCPEYVQEKTLRHEFTFLYDEETKRKMERTLVLEELIETMILEADRDRRYFVTENGETRLCHKQIGNITYWAAYEPGEGSFYIRNVYSHRVQICEQEVTAK